MNLMDSVIERSSSTVRILKVGSIKDSKQQRPYRHSGLAGDEWPRLASQANIRGLQNAGLVTDGMAVSVNGLSWRQAGAAASRNYSDLYRSKVGEDNAEDTVLFAANPSAEVKSLVAENKSPQ